MFVMDVLSFAAFGILQFRFCAIFFAARPYINARRLYRER